MSVDAYLFSYPKTELRLKVRQLWDNNKSVSHLDDVYWVGRLSFCWEGVCALIPGQKDGSVSGDEEFALTKEQLITFKQTVETARREDGEYAKHLDRSLDRLQKLIDAFDFDTKYLTLHTD